MASLACAFNADTRFGPSVASCRRAFDFTLFFEEAIFQLAPSCVFILFAAARLLVLAKKPAVAKLGTLHALKLSATITFAIINLIFLVFICTISNQTTILSVPAAVLLFITALCLPIVSHFEHTRSYCPSQIIILYLGITILLRSACVRTYWLLDGKGAIASTALLALIVQLVLVLLESWSKRNFFLDTSLNLSKEETAGFLSRSLFLWLDTILFTGYQRSFTPLDLQPIDSVLWTSKLSCRFAKILNTVSFGDAGLTTLTLRSLGLSLFYPILPRLCLTGFTFAQPFVTTSVIAYLGDEQPKSGNNGYGLIGATLLVYVGIAISNSWYWHLTYKSVVMMRGGLVDSVFEKMLKLRQDKATEAKAMTLMIADAQRIMSALSWMHELWAGPLEAVLATWLLWRQVGVSSLTVLGLSLCCTITSTIIGKSSGTQQGLWLAATEKRIAGTKRMLSSLKAIKMTGFEQRAIISLEDLRTREFGASKMFRSLMVGGIISSYVTLTLSPVIVFGTYLGATKAKKADFDTSRLFTSLILISLLASPLIRILQLLPSFGAARACFARLQTFLETKERADGREIHSSYRQGSKEGIPIISVVTLSDNASEKRTDSPANASVLSIRNADIGCNSQVLLKNVNLEVLKGEHIVIAGAVGCGKSLLLQAILGEIELLTGIIQVGSTSIGYCSQTPWLENIPALENAFRCTPDDEKWRQTVIEACALQELLSSHPPDEMIGSSGVRISGGERQRLALARTLAFRPAIVLLDDVFSAIDRKTEDHIAECLFGSKGIFRVLGTTIIQIVSDKRRATRADRIFEIDENGVLCSSKLPNEGGLISADTQYRDSPAATNGDSKLRETKSQADVTRISDRAVYKTYFSSIGRTHLLIFFLSGAAFVFTLKFPDIWVQWWSNASDANTTPNTGYWLGLYALLQILPLVTLCAWIGHLLLQIVPTSGIGLHKMLLKTLMEATFPFLSNIDTGSLLNRFNQDLNLVDMKLPLDLFNTAAEGLTSVVQTVLITVATAFVLAIIPILGIVLYLIQHFYLRTSKQLRQLDLESKSGLHTKLSETFAGLITIRAHGWQSILRHEFEEKLDRSQEPIYLLYMVQRWLQLTLNLVVTGLSVTVVGVAVARRNTTTAGAIGLAFLNMTTLGETMTNFIASWTSLETSLGAIARIKAFERDTPKEEKVNSPITPSPEWLQQGSIQFDNVYTTYDNNTENPIWSLRGVTFQINAGEKVAICGRTGSGKSSLLMSLLALIKVQTGTITIDCVDISRLEHSVLRSRLHVISQDPFEQGATVREALDPDSIFSDEVLIEILSECAVLEKINILGGLAGSMSEANFSVGEAQLFALARLILQVGPSPGGIVLLDEATSSLDIGTEKKIMKLISERLPKMTIVAVMHRLEAALEYERILVLEKGELIHSGTSSEVVQESELFSAFK